MKKIKNTKNVVFIENINMETQTEFHANGNIIIYPCDFERGQVITQDGNPISQKGKMVTESDGTSQFLPYAKDTGSRYKHLHQTAYGDIKESQTSVIFTLRFPKRFGRDTIRELYADETQRMAAFINSRNMKTEW